jgi:hypothetical protein
MKTKLMAMVMLAVVSVVLFSVNSFAAEAAYTCTISRIGGYNIENGSFFVRLTDTKGTFTNVYFKIDEGRLNPILAILLTAASNGSTVAVKADPVAKTLSYVYYNVE